MTDIEKLRSLARAATPGPWQADGDDVTPDPNLAEGIIAWCDFAQNDQHDAQYIAAADPATILALTERTEKAEAKLAAIGRLSPTHFDDREQLLGTITRILRGQFEEEETES